MHITMSQGQQSVRLVIGKHGRRNELHQVSQQRINRQHHDTFFSGKSHLLSENLKVSPLKNAGTTHAKH